MFETLSKFINNFLHGSQDQFILIVLIIITAFFSFLTVALFIITIYLRIKNNLKEKLNHRRCRNWDPIILDVMDSTVSAPEAYKMLKHRNSIGYLLHLELYIDMVKGTEKERLLALGKLSLKKLHKLLKSKIRKKQLYGVHLLGLFHPEEQYKYLKFNPKDFEYSFTMIREMRTINNFRVKERLIGMLFLFKYISPIYISNILVEMGEDIIPILKMIVLERKEHPYEQIIAIETVRRMHYTGCLELASEILHHNDNPMVLTSYLRYLEEMGDEKMVDLIKPFFVHPNIQVRIAAVESGV